MYQKKATGEEYPVHHNVLSESHQYHFLFHVDLLGSKKEDNFEVLSALRLVWRTVYSPKYILKIKLSKLTAFGENFIFR